MKLSMTHFCLVVISILLSYFYVDFPLALWIEKHIRGNTLINEYSSNLPSKLLMLVVVISTISWCIYGYMRLTQIHNRHRDFFLLLGSVLPVAYALKTLLKWVFGRLETRLWLISPEDYAMHWFNGINGYDAFPSGHMLVMTPLFLALWFFYRRYKIVVFSLWLALGLALIFTNYHYLSDVIAGVYVGLLTFFALSKLLKSPLR